MDKDKDIGKITRFKVGDFNASVTPEGLVIKIGDTQLSLGHKTRLFLDWLYHRIFKSEIELVSSLDPYLRNEEKLVVRVKYNGKQYEEKFYNSYGEDYSASAVIRFIDLFDEMLPLPEIKETYKSYAFTVWVRDHQEYNDYQEIFRFAK